MRRRNNLIATVHRLPEDYVGHCNEVGCQNVAKYELILADDTRPYTCALHLPSSGDPVLEGVTPEEIVADVIELVGDQWIDESFTCTYFELDHNDRTIVCGGRPVEFEDGTVTCEYGHTVPLERR